MINNPKQFQKQLLSWFDQHGRKQLPWQVQKTPYRVWISEVMLQQTQVSTVIPYFQRFMQRFPTVTILAQASEDEVLQLWAGLGYYSRARNIHKAAQQIAQNQGIFPDNFAGLVSLPGIGASTAGAILAIAYNQPATILDGNVKRVLTRFCGITKTIDHPSVGKKLWDIAEQLTPKTRIADYTQAVMDLGALVCLRGTPNCGQCPLQYGCIAYEKNIAKALPKKQKSRKLPVRIATFLVFQKGKQIFLNKRPSKGIWGGLWSLPEIVGEPGPTKVHQFCQQQFAIKVFKYFSLSPFRHTFTHFHLHIFPIVIKINHPKNLTEGDEGYWYDIHSSLSKGIPKPVTTIIEELRAIS